MPTYVFICLDCGKKFEQFFSYAEYGVKKAVCSYCGSENNRRKMTKVRVKRGPSEKIADLSDPSLLDRVDEDPKLLGKMMREMGNDMESDLPAEYGEVIDRLEAGQSPDEITSAMEGGTESASDDAVG